ncbi:MAG: hypothetical protein U1F36_18285 [Planctomycetota bacterium]
MIAHRFLGTALLPAALLATAAATAQGPLAKALPSDTILYLAMPDLDTSLAEFQATPLAKIWHEQQVQDFFAGVMKLGQAKWDEAMAQAREAHKNGMLPFDPDELVKMRIHSASFAVTKMDLAMPDAGNEPLPHFGLVAHLDFGDSAPIWQNVIQTGLAMLQGQAGDELSVTQSEIAGAHLTVLKPAEMPDFPMGLHLAFVGNSLVLTSLDEDANTVLTAMAGNAKQSLATSDGFKRASSKLHYQGAEMEFYMRPGAMLDFASNVLHMASEHAPGFPPMLDVDGIDRAVAALGLRSFDAIGATWNYDNERAVSDSYVSMPLDARRGLTAGASKPLDMGFLKWVPKDAVSFSASRLGFGNVYSSLVDALRAYNKDLAEQMLGHLAKMEENLGLSLEKDVFGALGDEVVSWSMPMAGMTAAPEMAYIIKVNNEEGLLKSLQKLASMSRGVVSIDKAERRGTTYWHIQLNLDDMMPMGGMNPLAAFTPTFAFKNGYLVGGLSTMDVRRASERMDREDDPKGDIRSNPEFKPYAQQIPAGATAVSFTDWKTSFDGIYQIVSAAMAFIPFSDDVPIDPALLPESSTFTKHLFGSLSYSSDSPDGVYSHSVGPFGPEMIVILGGAGIAGVATFAAVRGEFR